MRLSRNVLRVVIGAAVIIVVGYGALMRPTHPTTVEKVESELRSSPQQGQGRSDVESYLRQKGIEFSYVDGSTEDLAGSSEVEKTGVPISTVGGLVMGMIEDTSRAMLSHESIALTFVFDRKDRLLAWRVRSVYTGL